MLDLITGFFRRNFRQVIFFLLVMLISTLAEVYLSAKTHREFPKSNPNQGCQKKPDGEDCLLTYDPMSSGRCYQGKCVFCYLDKHCNDGKFSTKDECLNNVCRWTPIESPKREVFGTVVRDKTEPSMLMILDKPRKFVYEVKVADDSVVDVSYVAEPPTPSPSQKVFRLKFYSGVVTVGDQMRAYGSYDSSSNVLKVKEEGDYIETFPPSPKGVQTKFLPYGQGLYLKDVVNTQTIILKNSDALPKEFTLDGETLLLKQVELEKINRGFSLYLIVEYKNKEEKLGFWYDDSDPFHDTDGCEGGSACGGVASFKTKQWQGPPETGGSLGTTYMKFIALTNFYYNYETNSWNHIEISSQLLKEHNFPPATN